MAGKTSQPPSTISSAVATGMMDACNQNAASLFGAAEKLTSAKYFGHARSLLLLAYEEAIKGVAYYTVSRGLSTFDDNDSRRSLFIDEKLLGNHPLKQYLIFRFDLTLVGLAKGVRKEVEEGREPEIRPRRLVRALMEETSLGPLPTWEFNQWKNDGLYAMRFDSRVHSPQEITKPLHLEIRDRVAVRLLLALGLEHMPLSPEHLEEMRQQIIAGGLRLDVPTMRKFRNAEVELGHEAYWKKMIEEHSGLLDPLTPR